MQRVIAARGEHAIDGDEILHRRDLGRNDDPVLGEADFLGALRPRCSAERASASRVTARASIGAVGARR